MSALLIDEKTAQERLSSKDNLASRFNGGDPGVTHIQKVANKGPWGYPKIPKFIKVAAAVEARIGERSNTQIAKDYGINKETVNQLKNGSDFTGRGIEDIVNDSLAKLKDVAMEKLMLSLGLMTDEKLSSTNAIGLSNIARNLSNVVERTTPVDANKGVTQLIVYCPAPRREDLYEVVDV